MQQGVERRLASTMSMAEGLLVSSTTENEAFETRAATDAAGRIIWARDQAGGTVRYEYDALGRLAGVTLADGTHHRLSFDAFGRPAQVARDGLGAVSYVYEPVTGRLQRKEYRDTDGELERTIGFEYDAIGRVVERVHARAGDGAETRFTFRHDGDVGGGEIVPGQKGYTTQVAGPAYTATTVRNPDGSEATTTVTLADWMRIDIERAYHAGGALRQSHRVVTRLSDSHVIDDVTVGHTYDASGRLGGMQLNGTALATFHYDDEGRLAWVDLPGEQRIDHLYDATTHGPSGYTQVVSGESGPWQTGVEWTYSDCGLVASEAIDLADQSWLRTFGYEPRGYLASAEDADQLSTYTYTATGLPDQIADQRGSRAVFRGAARTITVAGIPYTYDASGRVIARGAAAFTYGPDGHLATATVGGRNLSYRHDADGNRILKYEGGVPVAGYLGGAYLTSDSFVEPIDIAGRVVGVLEGGQFHLLATDPRGTLLADRDGTPRLPTPYGVRATRPDLSAALDYVEKSYDADLESVRMGVRDYDPLLGQFWTPDPLFLESIDRCAESPVECNLFSYAPNNPLSFIDPDGLGVRDWLAKKWDQVTDKLIELDNDYQISFRAEAVGKISQGALIAAGTCVETLGAGCAVGAVRAGEGVDELISGQDKPDGVEALAGPRAAQAFQGVELAFALGSIFVRPVTSLLTRNRPTTAAAEGATASAGKVSCFAAGTQVHTEDGLVAIEEVAAGDMVWSRDEETGEVALRPVARTFVTPAQQLLSVVLQDLTGESDTLRVTGEHPFWTEGRGWVEARDLRAGERVLRLSGGWLRVLASTWEEERETVYNFEVEGFHTYFVGTQGAWVHNTCKTFTWMVNGGGILGEVSAKGVLTFAIEAGPQSAVRGHQLFAAMMKALGSEVKAIQGHWVYGTNLGKVNELTAAGMRLEEAVTKTWTATQARAYGFGNARVLSKKGSAGAFKLVDALFTK